MHICIDVCGGEWDSLHLLLWLGQDERGFLEVDPFEHVGGFERDRNIAHVPCKFLDRFHDVACGVDEQGRYLGNIWHVIHTRTVESA